MKSLRFVFSALIASFSLGLAMICLDIAVVLSNASNFSYALLGVLGFLLFASYAVVLFVKECV